MIEMPAALSSTVERKEGMRVSKYSVNRQLALWFARLASWPIDNTLLLTLQVLLELTQK